jgi:hypothetical protein
MCRKQHGAAFRGRARVQSIAAPRRGRSENLHAYTNRYDSDYFCCLGEMARHGQKSYKNRRRPILNDLPIRRG